VIRPSFYRSDLENHQRYPMPEIHLPRLLHLLLPLAPDTLALMLVLQELPPLASPAQVMGEAPEEPWLLLVRLFCGLHKLSWLDHS
jgi:hypothetical protein